MNYDIMDLELIKLRWTLEFLSKSVKNKMIYIYNSAKDTHLDDRPIICKKPHCKTLMK